MSLLWEGQPQRNAICEPARNVEPKHSPFSRGHGPAHPNWKGGKRKGERGHIRLSHGPDRHQYEHRVIVRELLREWNFYGWQQIPKGFTVHHLDFREDHNCAYNLLLLDQRIHQSFIKDYRTRLANGWFAPQPEPPDWVMA